MAKTTRSAGETVRITSQPSDRMKVWHLLDFADAVRAAGIPDSADVTASKSHDTFHTTGLSVSHKWAITPLGYEPTQDEATPEVTR